MKNRRFDDISILVVFFMMVIAILVIGAIYKDKEIDRLKSVPIYEQNLQDQETMRAIRNILVRRIVSLETALQMEPEDRHAWIITDLNEQIVACQEGPLISIELEVVE